MSAHLHAMPLKGKTKGRGTCSRPKSKDSLQSPDKCFKPADAMLLLIPEMWPVIVRVNRGSENFLYNYCSDIFNFMSCCWRFNWFSSPHLQFTPGAVPAHIRSAGLQTSTKRSGCAPLLLCICQYNGNLYCFFLGNKYKSIFPISAAWQSHKLTHITVCVSSSSTSGHCGQKLLRTYALTGRDTTELYWL